MRSVSLVLWLVCGLTGCDQDVGTLTRLAEHGDAVSQARLGLKYAEGDDVPQDYAAAARWYRLAAEQGDATAQFGLGSSYSSGRGVPLDLVQAHKWYNLAASSASDDRRNSYVIQRDALERRMTSEQVVDAQRLAREWEPKPWSAVRAAITDKVVTIIDLGRAARELYPGHFPDDDPEWKIGQSIKEKFPDAYGDVIEATPDTLAPGGPMVAPMPPVEMKKWSPLRGY